MVENRFARRLPELSDNEREIVAPAVLAAEETFGGFSDRPDSHYHQAPALSPEETWKRIAQELGRVSALTALEGIEDKKLEVEDFELIHRGVFEPVFGEETLRMRSSKTDEVTYPIVVGPRDNPRRDTRRGSGGKQVRPNLGKALKVFDRELASLARRRNPLRVSEAANPAVKLYAKTIGIHPFFDGNGRTAWAVLSYALQRCGLVEVAGAPTDDTRWALGRALRQDGSHGYGPLVDLIVETIKRSKPSSGT
jgi:hypothetical protein